MSFTNSFSILIAPLAVPCSMASTSLVMSVSAFSTTFALVPARMAMPAKTSPPPKKMRLISEATLASPSDSTPSFQRSCLGALGVGGGGGTILPELVRQTPPAPGKAFSSTSALGAGGASSTCLSYGAMSVGGVDGAAVPSKYATTSSRLRGSCTSIINIPLSQPANCSADGSRAAPAESDSRYAAMATAESGVIPSGDSDPTYLAIRADAGGDGTARLAATASR